VERDDHEAFRYFKLAAELGHADAQNHLANCYVLGRGTSVNPVQGFAYYSLAAEQDHAESAAESRMVL